MKIITLTAIRVVMRVIYTKENKFSVTVTNKQDELLVDISKKNIIFHDEVNVYINGKRIS